MKLTITTRSEEETIAVGAALGRLLAPGDVIALHGDLGAGKTRFVRGVATGVGADPAGVSSPTFVVMQEYRCPVSAPIGTLVHMDAYRLAGADELDTIGWDRIARELELGEPVAAVIEWAERIERALPTGATRLDVRMAHAPELGHSNEEGSNTRVLTFESDASWSERSGWSEIRRFSTASKPVRTATRCPVTGKPVSADSPTYPFFDEQARLADLGRWFSGSYQVSREIDPDDLPLDEGA